MKRKKRKGRQRKIEVTYWIEILEHTFSYFFSLALNDKFFPGPYWEHASLNIKGRLLQPLPFINREIELTILGSRDLIPALESPETCRHEPKAVGGLTIRGKVSDYTGSVPFDALVALVRLMDSGSVRFLDFTGEPLYRGHARIRSMSFEKEYKPDTASKSEE